MNVNTLKTGDIVLIRPPKRTDSTRWIIYHNQFLRVSPLSLGRIVNAGRKYGVWIETISSSEELFYFPYKMIIKVEC